MAASLLRWSDGMKHVVCVMVGIALLAGCARPEARIAFDGKYFRTRLNKVDGQRDQFTVKIRDAAKSIEGAREAGRYEGTSYCVNTYGNSDIKWVVGPDTPPEQLRLVDGDLTFRGACPN